jgi:hypothetical protein
MVPYRTAPDKEYADALAKLFRHREVSALMLSRQARNAIPVIMPPSSRKKWIGGVSAIAAVGLIGALWATRSHPLSERSTRVADGSFRAYVWQSPDRLALLLTTDQFEQRDLKTGARAVGTLGSATPSQHVWRASPDGQRLLAFDNGPAFTVLEQGTVVEQRDDFEGWGGDAAAMATSGIAWLPDSRRWLAWSPHHSKAPLRLYSVDAPNGPPIKMETTENRSHLIGVTPDLLVVQADAPAPPAAVDHITLTHFGVYPNRAPRHTTTFRLPTTAQIAELELAPQGDRLAWLFVDARRSPLITMLIRLFPALAGRFPPTEGISVWVSRLDGTEMHEIGFEQTHATGKETNVATDLRWVPDGKRLSYLMNGALYTVPAP